MTINDINDFEQRLFDTWNVVKDIDSVREFVEEGKDIKQDPLGNVLLGMFELYTIKFNKLKSLINVLNSNTTDQNVIDFNVQLEKCEGVVREIDDLFVEVIDNGMEMDELVKKLFLMSAFYENCFSYLFDLEEKLHWKIIKE